MINFIPVVGWIIHIFFIASLSVPFWFWWTLVGLGEKYFSFLPEVWQRIPFWHCVGLFTILSIVKMLVPKLVDIEQTQKNKE